MSDNCNMLVLGCCYKICTVVLRQEVGDAASYTTTRLSKLGGSGKHPQNVERDLFRFIKLPLDAQLYNAT